MTERARNQNESKFAPLDTFVRRHVGPDAGEIQEMLASVGVDSLAALMDQVVPETIRTRKPLDLQASQTEAALLDDLAEIASENQVFRSLIGMGYADCVTPGVIQRNILENPGWYTQYTPYQAEISQGRMEALINFQTMVSDLTGLPLANASMLDEATAAAEAMMMCYAIHRKKKLGFFVDQACHPQTIAVVETRATPLGLTLHIGDPAEFDYAAHDLCGALFQYPATDGRLWDMSEVAKAAKDAGATVVMAAELMALPLLKSPGSLGAEIAVGSTQRFGVPLGFGGPHAAYLSTEMNHRRMVPGRLIGVSKDVHGKVGYRLSLQTREQHIRRDRATSNICTSQVLLAVIAGMYAVYHGPEGIKAIASRIHHMTKALGEGLESLGFSLRHKDFFDTLRVVSTPEQAATLRERALAAKVNLRYFDDGDIGLTLDETCDNSTLDLLLKIFGGDDAPSCEGFGGDAAPPLAAAFARDTDFLTHEVFQMYRCEHEMLRYIHRLQGKDLSLTHSMIPLGSCTMKLNGTTEMVPITWPEFGAMHPFAPTEQWRGYKTLFEQLEAWLAEMTGFAATSLQPNAGSQGEYAGLLTIRAYHQHRGDTERDVCLIPVSAHGTNPASAVMAGMKVVPVACNERGDIDVDDLRAKSEQHKDKLAALMITYPSTHGVFEEKVKEACAIVHENGGQVYMDGANMNAQLGLTSPGDIGADVCHLNLHKTFCLSEGTPVALADGVNRPIESLLPGQRVLAWSEQEKGIRAADLEAVFATGTKPCVEVTLEDGRTFTCTADHRVLTTQGWCEAGKLDIAHHRMEVGPDLPLDDPKADLAAESQFRREYGDFVFTMKTHEAREKTLAFFRLLGLLYSDGTYSQEQSGRRHARMYLGAEYDAIEVVNDIERLCGVRPTICQNHRTFDVRLPAPLLHAFEAMRGIHKPGKRADAEATLPTLLTEAATPKAIVREFLGGLFGGDGCSPLIVHLEKNPNTLKEIKFFQSRSSKDVVDALMQEICELLGRLGVESYTHEATRTKKKAHDQIQNNQLWRGGLTIVWGTAFAERVGFRYCTHKNARLAAATAWWRMRENILKQKKTVAQRVLDFVAGMKKRHLGPTPVWRPALAEVYSDFAAQEHVLNPYFVGFQGFKQLLKSHFVKTIEGQRGDRKDIQGLRRTHRRAVLPSVGRGGEETGMPTLDAFLTRIGARDWFNQHTKLGESYSVAYATTQTQQTQPTLKLQVVSVKPVGERRVYDLTVAKDHSFLANGAVVHNCIPHGGGGPGMGPICVASHLAPFLPGHPVHQVGGEEAMGPVSAAPYGSPSILPISWVYIALMGGDGLEHATQVAILNANYMASRLKGHYEILYTGPNDRVAHEFVIDLRPFKATTGVEVVDVAKRLMDFGFHSPTMSWPVPGTLMIEPTESEAKGELDRFCDAMIVIRQEIQDIADGKSDRENNPLKHAPHPFDRFAADEWPYAYSRQQAAFPAPWVRERKFWPSVARIDDAYGDRNLMCSCPPMDSY